MSAPLESTKFYLLLALAKGPQTSAEIRSGIIGDSLGIYLRDSTLYEALGSIARDGLIERDTRKVYRLNEAGKQRLEHERARSSERYI